MSAKRTPEFAAQFFLVRTPLLPFDDYVRWSEGADRATLRDRLRAIVERPEVREALRIASADFDERLQTWIAEPEGEKGRRIELALVRYLLRMMARATPFGLFAGCSVGEIGDNTDLALAGLPTYRRVTRFDREYLFRIRDLAVADPRTRYELRCAPNSSITLLGGTYRYLFATATEHGLTYDLYRVEPTAHLADVLEFASQNPSVRDVGEMLVQRVEGITADEAREYVEDLLESQILVLDCAPAVTGNDPLDGVIAPLRDIPSARWLHDACMDGQRLLQELDRRPLGVGRSVYDAVRSRMQTLGDSVRAPHQLQVDMFKPLTGSQLGGDVTREMLRSVEFLRRLPPLRNASARALEAFAVRFVRRYEKRRVPLLEALDADVGIGYDDPETLANAEPLIQGLFAADASEEISWRAHHDTMLRLLYGALRQNKSELIVSEEDARVFPEPATVPLPDAFHFHGTLLARSMDAVNEGDYRLAVAGVSGPAGANLLGRFCHGDATLYRYVRELFAREEARNPDSIHAEIVHIPPRERLGNFICRPVLREWEIPYMGRSGAPPERRISVGDLLVSVVDGVVQIHSIDGRRVLPRMANAHAHWHAFNLPVYRLLCSVQQSGLHGSLGWNWGPMRSLPFLPRVVHGRSILHPMAWTLSRRDLPPLDGRGSERRRAVDAWRAQWNVPRWIVVQELCIDLENELALDTLAKLAERRERLAFEELLGAEDGLCLRGPEGRFVHEIVVPFLRISGPMAAAVKTTTTTDEQRFIPGSEWLYAAIYAGLDTSDDILRDAIAPMVRRLKESGRIARWFFIRYHDPDLHLRVRFHGEPRVLMDTVAPALRAALQPFVDRQLVWRVRFDTYERETDRYGGPAGIVLAEEVFEIDSDAVLEMLAAAEHDLAETRWRFALAGADRMLVDFGLARGQRLEFFKQAAQSFKNEHGPEGHQIGRNINARFRDKLRSLTRLYTDEAGEPLEGILRRRSERLRPVARRIREACDSGSIPLRLEELLYSYVHMHVNRALRIGQRKQELVLYDLAAKLNAALVAQKKE